MDLLLEGRIAQADYDETIDRLSLDILNASEQSREVALAQAELFALLDKVARFVEHPDAFYNSLPGKGKRALVSLYFPKGAVFENGKCRTATINEAVMVYVQNGLASPKWGTTRGGCRTLLAFFRNLAEIAAA